MSNYFNEDNTIEQMVISSLRKTGWKYIAAEELPRMYSDVLVEPKFWIISVIRPAH